jgi:hypothetical protein
MFPPIPGTSCRAREGGAHLDSRARPIDVGTAIQFPRRTALKGRNLTSLALQRQVGSTPSQIRPDGAVPFGPVAPDPATLVPCQIILR